LEYHAVPTTCISGTQATTGESLRLLHGSGGAGYLKLRAHRTPGRVCNPCGLTTYLHVLAAHNYLWGKKQAHDTVTQCCTCVVLAWWCRTRHNQAKILGLSPLPPGRPQRFTYWLITSERQLISFLKKGLFGPPSTSFSTQNPCFPMYSGLGMAVSASYMLSHSPQTLPRPSQRLPSHFSKVSFLTRFPPFFGPGRP
jgi:hypothetical protein